MKRRLRLAALAALLGLLLSAATVPFAGWHHIYRTAWIADPEHVGRVKQIAVTFPIYWFYVAAGLGTFLASFTELGSGEGLRARTVFLFLVLSDLTYAWVGGIGYICRRRMVFGNGADRYPAIVIALVLRRAPDVH